MAERPSGPRASRLSVSGAAAEAGSEPALITPARTWTWEEVGAEALRRLPPIVAESGESAVPPVAFAARADAETVFRVYAALEAGVPAALLHPRLPAPERAARAKAAGARPWPEDREGSFAAASGNAPDAGPDVRDDGRPGVVLFTSGTTAGPRAVELSRRALVAAADASAAHLGWRADDRWLACLSPAHVGGLSILVRCLIARRPAILTGRFEPQAVLEAVRRHRATLISVVPTMLAALLEREPRWRPPATLRAVLVGGAPTPDRLWAAARGRDVPALATYGLTEAASQVATARPEGDPRVPFPLPGIQVRIRGGRIEVRSPALLTRYLPPGVHPDPRTADGWLRTGDRGRLREDGGLEVLGRADAVIVTGGEKVAPEEVESALRACRGVRDAIVFGIPDPRWGELVAALLVPEGDPPDDGELRAWLEASLAPHLRPRRVAWTDALPVGPTGKVDRSAVRQATGSLRPL